MIIYRIVQILFLVSSMTSQVINSMMPEDISKSPSQERSHINSMPLQVEGIVKRIDQLPKELRYKIISFALELQVNKKYEVYKKFDVGSWVKAIALNADNTRALTASRDGVIRLWDVEKEELIKELKGPTETVLSVTLSADSCIALKSSLDGMTRVFNINTGKLLKTLQVGSLINSVLLSADGKTAITVLDCGDVLVWNTLTGKLINNFKVNATDRSVALSADGKIALTTGSWDGNPGVWNALTGELLKTLQVGAHVISGALSADGTIALTAAGYDNKVLVWDAKLGALLNTLLTDSYVDSVALSKDGKRAFVGTGDNKIQVWNTQPLRGQKETNKPLTVLAGHTEMVTALVFGSADFIASGSYDNTALIWKPFTPENHYWPLKEGKLNWEALTEQEMAAWEDFIEIFYKPNYAFLQESVSCNETNSKLGFLGTALSYLLG